MEQQGRPIFALAENYPYASRNRPSLIVMERFMSGDATRRLTRNCDDPWTYVEISANGGVRPCCNFQDLANIGDGQANFETIRNNSEFRALRQSLIDGNLSATCQRCNIRKSVTPSFLKAKLRVVARSFTLKNTALPISILRIDINEKCNLRCDYCAVSAPSYNGVEMNDSTFDKLESLLRTVGPIGRVHVNGHGETTYHPRWMELCEKVIASGHRTRFLTNLAKEFTDQEIELLSKFDRIGVSIDSDDPELLRRIRKAVRVDHILSTIDRIRDCARARHRRAPKFTFSVGVYDPSIWGLERFVSRAMEFGIYQFYFWNLTEYSHQKLVKPLATLEGDNKMRAIAIINTVRRKLNLAGALYTFSGDFAGVIDKPTVQDYVCMGLGQVRRGSEIVLKRQPRASHPWRTPPQLIPQKSS
jgi:radical SAM protein with 4Fe4S-binding SPASM domain